MAVVAARQHSQQGFTLIELMVAIAILGIVAAITIPTYMRYQAKARQAEVRSLLGQVFVSEIGFFGESGRYSDFTEVGFSLASTTNRYTYRAERTDSSGTGTGAVQVFNATIGQVTGENSVVPAHAVGIQFSVTATANLDSDTSIDEWHVNDIKQNLLTPDTNDVTNG